MTVREGKVLLKECFEQCGITGRMMRMTEKKDGMVNLPPEAVTAVEQAGLSTEVLEKVSATILTGKRCNQHLDERRRHL